MTVQLKGNGLSAICGQLNIRGKEVIKMRFNYKVKIGLAPVRRDVTPRQGIFNWEFAETRGANLVHYIIKHFENEHVSFVDSSGINAVNTIINEEDADNLAIKFLKEGVDAILVINTNFGNEEAIAELARKVRVPILLWAPLDDFFDQDGMRYTDSQCGLFGMSRLLMRYKIPYSYIPSCKVDDPEFFKEFDKFVRVSCIVKNFRNLRVGMVGLRPKPFTSVMYNEDDLLEQFGIRMIPINLAVIIDHYNKILKTRQDELEKGAKLLASRYQIDNITFSLLNKMYAFVLLYRELFEEYDLSLISAECWTAMQLAVGAMPCTAYSVLADQGYLIGCESDTYATISLGILSCAALGEQPPFLGEFTVRHPTDTNSELLWHCGPFAYSLKKDGSPCKNVNMRQWFQLKDGHYTICRMDEDAGRFSILPGEFDSTDGPYTFGTYIWAKFDDGRKWEKKIMEGPYIHHFTEVSGSYSDVIREFCKYEPNLHLDSI